MRAGLDCQTGTLLRFLIVDLMVIVLRKSQFMTYSELHPGFSGSPPLTVPSIHIPQEFEWNLKLVGSMKEKKLLADPRPSSIPYLTFL